MIATPTQVDAFVAELSLVNAARRRNPSMTVDIFNNEHDLAIGVRLTPSGVVYGAVCKRDGQIHYSINAVPSTAKEWMHKVILGE